MKQFRTVRDVVEFAITLEQASQKFYQRLASQAQSPSVKHFLGQMVIEEQSHEAQLRDMVEDGGGILTQEISSHDMDRYIDAMNIPEPLDYKEAIRLARDKEKASRMLYTILSGMTGRADLSELFTRLAQQEQNHYDYFVRQYRSICVGQN